MEYYSMKHVDMLDGREFEKFTGTFLRALGYEGVKVTKSSGDFGIDVLSLLKNTV